MTLIGRILIASCFHEGGENPPKPHQVEKFWPVQYELFCSDVSAEGEKFHRDDSQIPECAECAEVFLR